MPLVLRSPITRNLTAAASAATVTRRAASEEPGNSLKPWQKLAWGYYKTLGEIHYGGGFFGRMLSNVRFYVEERNADGEWEESADEEYRAQIERLENARGGMSEIAATYGVLRFVQGEALLCCTLEGYGVDEDGEPIVVAGETSTEVWEMLSAAELSYSKEQKEYTRRSGGAGAGKKIPETDPANPLPGTMIAYRFYHRDPEFSGLADSSLRAVLDDCEELLLLKQSIRNTARNRGSGNGILFLPSTLGGNEVDRGDGVKVPKNAKAIFDALTAPIADEKAASAVTPLVLFGADVTRENAFHLDLRGAALYRETGLRDECIRRIAIGLDMPPEALLGTAGVNHWSAWQIDESSWKNHGAGVAREFVEQLTSALLAPIAIERDADPADVRVWYDATDVVEDPDRSRTAQEAHGMLIISDAAARRDMGYDDEDAPDDAEWQRRAELSPHRGGRGASDPVGAEPGAGAASTRLPPVAPERVIGMAEACLLRCRELAGSRLRSRMQSSEAPANLRARIRSASNADVAARLGADVRDDADADALVAGAGQVFLAGLHRLGLEPGLAESLVRRVEEHAARTLFDDKPGDLPDEVIALCALTSMRV